MSGVTYNFGAGDVWITPTGPGITDKTPIKLLTLQDIKITESGEVKELHGANAFAEDVATGKRTISGTATSARFNSDAQPYILYGIRRSTGAKLIAKEVLTVPAAAPYESTVVNGAQFVQNLGLIDPTTAVALKQVDSNPQAGEYSIDVLTGKYTFSAADADKSFGVEYKYSVATGKTVDVNNFLMGQTWPVQLDLAGSKNGQAFVRTYYQAIFSSMDFDMKNDDYAVANLTFNCFADSLGRVKTDSFEYDL